MYSWGEKIYPLGGDFRVVELFLGGQVKVVDKDPAIGHEHTSGERPVDHR